MSYFSARLFTWLQGAEFYQRIHREAVAALPPAASPNTLWLDVGCGPGLVTRLAAGRGYSALGLDRDPHMVQAARRIARRDGSAARFEVGDLASLDRLAEPAQVVSAASLLAVVRDPAGVLETLLRSTQPGGTVLIIEPTAAMTRTAARDLIASGRLGKRALALRLWARAREGRAVDSRVLHQAGCRVEKLELLDGLVAAWTIHRAVTS